MGKKGNLISGKLIPKYIAKIYIIIHVQCMFVHVKIFIAKFTIKVHEHVEYNQSLTVVSPRED